MLTSVANGAETYVYDAQSNRVEVHGSTVTDFVYFNGRPIAMLNGGSYTDLIYAGNSLIAEVSGTQSAAPIYQVLDNVGSLQGAAPSSGLITGAVNYAPYGQIFTGSTSDPFQFASLEWDSTSAMYHAGYRQFSPQQGRWMTADPYGGSYVLENPQSLNRYMYVNGDPLDSSDPSGLVLGWANGIGGGPCSYADGINGGNGSSSLAPNPNNPIIITIGPVSINPCSPLASALSIGLYYGLRGLGEEGIIDASELTFKKIIPWVSFGISLACSIDSKTNACGESGWASVLGRVNTIGEHRRSRRN